MLSFSIGLHFEALSQFPPQIFPVCWASRWCELDLCSPIQNPSNWSPKAKQNQCWVMLSAGTLTSNRLITSSNYWSWLPLLHLGTRWSKADQNLSSVLDHLIKNQGLHEPKRLKFRSPATHWLVKTSQVCPLCHRSLLNFWNKSRKKKGQSDLIFLFAIIFCILPLPPTVKYKYKMFTLISMANAVFPLPPRSLWCVRWWLFKRWEIGWWVTRRRIRGPHIAGRWWQGLGVIREARGSGGWKHAGMLQGDKKRL